MPIDMTNIYDERLCGDSFPSKPGLFINGTKCTRTKDVLDRIAATFSCISGHSIQH